MKYKIHSRVMASLLAFAPVQLLAANATTAGTPESPYPTLHNLSIEWPISGDDNFNGQVSMRYRKQGTTSWLTGLPLRHVHAGSNQGFSWGNKHSGSIFDLLADTTYEIELTLTDVDGGGTTRTLTATTRAEPQIPEDATIVSANTGNFSSIAGNASPNTVIEMAAGSYSGFTVRQNGQSGAPIVFRAATPGSVTVNGDISLDGRSNIFIEGLKVNGTIEFANAHNIVIRGNTVTTNDHGIVAQGNGVTNAVVTDNIVLGSTEWANSSAGNNGDNVGEGIELTGPGNVIAYNYVKGFRDCISTLEDDEAVNQVSIDIYNNDIEVGADDAIEADFTMGNTRVMRNRITNSYVGISGQPTLGGPLYMIRNVMYNVVYTPFKLYRGSEGDVGLHNTVVKTGDAFANYSGTTWSYAYFRNNLFIGGTGGGTYGGYSNGSGRVAQLSDADSTCTFDYDAYGSIDTGTFRGRIGSDSFTSLSQMQSDTTEQHAISVDMSVFAANVSFPSGPFPEKDIPDLRLASDADTVDAGLLLQNVNADYNASGPDMGAYEYGDELPVYGPRPGRHFSLDKTDTVAPSAPVNLTVE